MTRVFAPFKIRQITLKNRIVMPPMVVWGQSGQDGKPTEQTALYYAKRARGGVGMIIVEATCVNENGRLAFSQLGLWEDAQMEGHQRLVDAVHVYDCPVLVQLHHAGVKTVCEDPVSSSELSIHTKDATTHARAMREQEVQSCIEDFIAAAKRANSAGYDGVELHGAHGYLISQFLCEGVNKRTDSYGGSLLNRTRFASEIIRGIRKECGDDFVIGIRMGSNEPDATISAQIIALLEQEGLDFCHISSGYHSIETSPTVPPREFAFSKRVYGAKLVREMTRMPLICVGEVRSIETAEAILEADIADLVAIGRGLLADEDLVYKSEQGQKGSVYTCLHCSPCRYYEDGTKCPQQVLAKRNKDMAE